jgi:hypothetical protein
MLYQDNTVWQKFHNIIILKIPLLSIFVYYWLVEVCHFQKTKLLQNVKYGQERERDIPRKA